MPGSQYSGFLATSVSSQAFILPLAQESLTHLTPDFQSLVWISQDFEQLSLNRRFHDGLKHSLELLLAHLGDLVLRHIDPFSQQASLLGPDAQSVPREYNTFARA
jgi:hypothetical protein